MARPMVARDPAESHRVATPLELLFDLCFVVAIAQGARGLHHGLAAGHVGETVVLYAMVFFAVWWAWMQFTWFASAYDPDDTPYRLLVLLQIVGVLVIAAGIPRVFAHHDFLVVTIGFVILRIAMVALWLRAARADDSGRRTAHRYALGITLCQLGWIAILFLPLEQRTFAFAPLCLCELAVPVWGERAGETRWHPHHITERYSLFTLIVLGESVAAATLAIQAAVDVGAPSPHLITVIAGAPLIFFSMWWMYFAFVETGLHGTSFDAYAWGYGHYLLFGSAAAVGAGLSVAVEHPAGLAVAIPAAIYMAMVWFVHCKGRHPALLIGPVLVIAAGFLPWAELAIGVLMVALTGMIPNAARETTR